MAEPFLGEIKLWALNYAPRGWAACDGQILPINQNQALFALLGTRYGGNGMTTFQLPDLRGRVAIHQGNGHTMGEKGGSETATLTLANLPGDHGHDLLASPEPADEDSPEEAVLARAEADIYLSPGAKTQPMTLNAASVGPGQPANQPHENRQPYLALQYCIALQGIFPTRS